MNDKVLQPIKIDVGRFKREFSRLSKMTTFQRLMDKAIETKANAWMDYVPLSKAQLFDDEMENITVVSTFANGDLSSSRSTHRGAGWHTQYTVLKRPTEVRAILHAQGLLVLESDFVVVRQESNKEMRWCILCRKEHEVFNFVSHKRYLNGLSYACKHSLNEGKRGTWKYAA